MRHMLASTIMLSSMLIPAVANASPSVDDVTAPTANIRISTGVVGPVLTNSIDIPLPDGLSHDFVPVDAQVGLSLKVNANGKAEDVKVIKGSNPYWDARVVDAVQRSHFRPGTIDNQAIPMDVNLTVVMAH